MKGKEKCKALKEIRRQIAEKNDIEYAVSECTYQGECKGTCPKCEAELRYLERELAIRQNLGKAVAIAGISVGVCAPMAACSPLEMISDVIYDLQNGGQLEGDVQYIPEEGVAPAPPTTEMDLEGEAIEVEPPVMGEIESEDNSEVESEIDSEELIIEGDIQYIPESN